MATLDFDLNQPVWSNTDATIKNPDVKSLFANPNWVTGDPGWIGCMKHFGATLDDGDAVWSQGNDIYEKLNGGGMPPDPDEQWPPDALKMFRLWFNEGGRNAKSDPFPGPRMPPTPIPEPGANPSPELRPFRVPQHPVWDSNDLNEDDIKQCFTNPCWIKDGDQRAATWRLMMKQFQYDAFTGEMFDLHNYDHIKGWALTVYNHLASGSMPVEDKEENMFSSDAIKAFKIWYDEGCPRTPSDVGHMPLPPAPAPLPPVNMPFQLRKDINALSEAELQAYRMAVLKLNSNSLTASTWQTGGYLHAHWCLHYMQASFPWHRAHLMWLEAELGVPIPYWNFFSSQATNPNSADYGIPKAFMDDTFIDVNGQEQPNPLRHALARAGKSRASTGATTLQEIQRDPNLTDLSKRDTYIAKWVPQYLKLIWDATQISTLTQTAAQDNQGFTFGTPDLTTWNDVTFYPQVTTDFDVALEQAHDNYHGWCGPDMANNSFAAYDPLFWSFHANFDRIFETWLRKTAKPDIQWEPTPLRPFVFSISGTDTGTTVEVSIVEDGDPKTTKYATAVDMVQESSTKLGFAYGFPNSGDFIYSPPSDNSTVASSEAPAAVSQVSAELEEASADAAQASGSVRMPFVLFPDTKCTDNTYYIHVALDKVPNNKLVIGEPGYIGHLTRLGMGPDNGNNRCIQRGIIRKLDGAVAAQEIKLQPTDPLYLKVLVKKDVPDGENVEISGSEYKSWEGFSPILLW